MLGVSITARIFPQHNPTNYTKCCILCCLLFGITQCYDYVLGISFLCQPTSNLLCHNINIHVHNNALWD